MSTVPEAPFGRKVSGPDACSALAGVVMSCAQRDGVHKVLLSQLVSVLTVLRQRQAMK